MSTRASSRKKKSNGVDTRKELPRHQLISVYRHNAMRTIRDIRKGIVNESDIDKLQNFVQTSLWLMGHVSVETFRQAQINAELGHFLTPSDEDKDVVLNEDLQLAAQIAADVPDIIKSELDKVFTTPQQLSIGQLMTDVRDVSAAKTIAEQVPEAQLPEAIAAVNRMIDENAPSK